MIDITIVLFRPRWDEVMSTLANLAAVSDEYETLRILVSGRTADHEKLADALATYGLADSSDVVYRWDNLGFASGHNLLLSRAFRGDAAAVLVLNPDVEIASGAITKLAEVSSQKCLTSLVGPALRSVSDGRPVVDSMGVYWTADGRHFDRGQGEPWPESLGGCDDVDGLTGACLLASRAVYDRLLLETGSFFDDAFLAYREDAELGIRAREIGISSVVFSIEGFFHERHVKGASRGRPLPDLLGVRNRFLLRWKLGAARPGLPLLPTFRDLTVAVAVAVVERRSLAGLYSAWAIRRSTKYSGRPLALAAQRRRA